jgi:hypothetical protein
MLMHASLAYLNRAGNKRRTRSPDDDRETLRVLNILLGLQPIPVAQCRWGPSDPDDPTNPNEVRERFLRKLRR